MWKRNFQEARKDEIDEIEKNLLILILRKSAGMMKEYVSLHNNKNKARRKILEYKYKLSKVRPEVLDMMTSISVRLDDIIINQLASSSMAYVFDDKQTETRFRYYVVDKNHEKFYNVNSQKIFNSEEAILFVELTKSIYSMKERQHVLYTHIKNEKATDEIFKAYKKN